MISLPCGCELENGVFAHWCSESSALLAELDKALDNAAQLEADGMDSSAAVADAEALVRKYVQHYRGPHE
jgi:hypothetical protein